MKRYPKIGNVIKILFFQPNTHYNGTIGLIVERGKTTEDKIWFKLKCFENSRSPLFIRPDEDKYEIIC